MLMFGSGGVEVEGLKDVSFGLAPLTRTEARKMIESTWAGKKLKGFRSIAPADQAAAEEVLLRLSQLASDHPQIQELEINPLRVMANSTVAIDVRGKLG
jgi:acetyltransferase